MDDLKNEFEIMKQSIEKSELDNPNQIYFQFQESQQSKKKWMIFKKALLYKHIALIVLVLHIVMGIGIYMKYQNMKGNLTTKVVFGDTSANKKLHQDAKRATSLSEIKQLFMDAKNYQKEDLNVDVDISFGTSQCPPSSSLQQDRTYLTNTQEEGVEEADIVKINGDYIYYISIAKDTLYILQTNKGEIRVIKQHSFSIQQRKEKNAQYGSIYPVDLYYTDKYLIVRASSTMSKSTDTIYFGVEKYTEIFIYDIHTYEEITNVSVPGQNVSTRLIDNALYVVNNDSGYQRKLSEKKYSPVCFIDHRAYAAPVDKIYYCPSYGLDVDSYIVIYRFVLDEVIRIDDFYLVSSTIQDIYVTQQAIYILKTDDVERVQDEMKLTELSVSKILVIDISESIQMNGVITINGIVEDKYWLSEYNGYLRVVSQYNKTTYVSKKYYEYESEESEIVETIGLLDYLKDDVWYHHQVHRYNQLSILQQNENGVWEEIGLLDEGIGKIGESVKSVRFNKEIVTIVTYRNTDPLYYIDLTNPKQPTITSELKISGYSVYQHPYQDDYVIGIGYESIGLSISGYKIALFDIRDASHIVQVGNPYIFNASDYSEPAVLSNPKELFLDLENDRFGFSITDNLKLPVIKNLFTFPIDIELEGSSIFKNATLLNHSQQDIIKPSKPQQKYYYYVFTIDVESENPIQVIFEALSEEHNFRRMTFIGDYYYLLSSDTVYSYQVINGQFLPYEALQLF